jgi:plasmid stabilization system protein ParE
LSDILSYLDEHSPQGARNIKRAMNKAVALIGRYPKIGRFSGVEETRVFPVGRYPYLIYWSIEAGEVWIFHIRHARRRPWADELSDRSD